jgi:hypothetical protein
VKNGLQPYNKLGQKMPPPDISYKLNLLKELESQLAGVNEALKCSTETRRITRIRLPSVREKNEQIKVALESNISTLKDQLKNDIYSWKSCELPSSEEETINIIRRLIGSYYRREDNPIILQEDSSPSHDDQQKIEKLMLKARPDIEKIYHAISTIGFSARVCHSSEEYKISVLNLFGKKLKIGLILRKYVEDDKLYEFPLEHQRRRFIGMILKKIMIKNKCNNRTGQELFKIYQRLPRQ